MDIAGYLLKMEKLIVFFHDATIGLLVYIYTVARYPTWYKVPTSKQATKKIPFMLYNVHH